MCPRSESGTGVTVTQGKVRVSGLDDLLTAGQQIAPDGQKPTAAPRLPPPSPGRAN